MKALNALFRLKSFRLGRLATWLGYSLFQGGLLLSRPVKSAQCGTFRQRSFWSHFQIRPPHRLLAIFAMLCVWNEAFAAGSNTIPSFFSGIYQSPVTTILWSDYKPPDQPFKGASAQEVCKQQGLQQAEADVWIKGPGSVTYLSSSPTVLDEQHGLCNHLFRTSSNPSPYPVEGNWYKIFACSPNSILELYDYTSCICKEGFVVKYGACVRPPPPRPSEMCKASPADGEKIGNPVIPMTGDKMETETDFSDAGPASLSLTRVYRSSFGLDESRTLTGFGRAWTHNHGARLTPRPAENPPEVTIEFSEGQVRTFKATGVVGTWTNSGDPSASLTQSGDGSWVYRGEESDATFNFDSAGKLRNQVSRNGWTTSYSYDAAGRIESITNAFGRTLSLAYSASNQISSVTTPDARVLAYAYDAQSRLVSVTYPDGKSRGYLYEDASLPQALTGIVDEAGVRYATYTYDRKGNAIGTEHAGGVNRYQIIRSASPGVTSQATVIDPLGTSRNFGYSVNFSGRSFVTSGSLPSAEGLRDAFRRTLSADTSTFSIKEADFTGGETYTTLDKSRFLPIRVNRDPFGEQPQITTTEWHPTFRLPLTIIEGVNTRTDRTTAYFYDTAGNRLKEVVTDRFDSPVPKTREWTYNNQQLIATATESNGAVTSYSYDFRGNLIKSVNALGYETLYGYDNANRVTSSTAPNGLVTTYAYDQRDRLLIQSVGSLNRPGFPRHF